MNWRFVVAWLVIFPLACGLATLSIAIVSPMSGPNWRLTIESPTQMIVAAMMFAVVAIASKQQIWRMRAIAVSKEK